MADTQQVEGDGDGGTRDSDGAGGAEARRAARHARRVTRLARQIGSFVTAHGGAEGQIAYLGRKGARIVLVGGDGEWGDLVAPSHDLARQAAEKAGITVQDKLDGDLAARMHTGPYEWSRMAGIQIGGRSAS